MGSKQRIMAVFADEFLHVLLKGLVRIRYFGPFASR